MIAKAAQGKRASGASKTSGRLSVQLGFGPKHQFGKIPPIRSADFLPWRRMARTCFEWEAGGTHKKQNKYRRGAISSTYPRKRTR